MKLKFILGGVAIVAASSLVLTGCGRSGDQGAAGAAAAVDLDDAPATGKISVWVMGVEGETLPEYVAAFEEANPDADVEVTAVPWESAYSRFQTSIAGGSTPDIAMVGTTWMSDFADAMTTVPDEIDTSGMFPGAVDTTEIDGRVVGVPWYVETRVLYYRTDLAAAAGWNAAPKSWDDLHQMAADIQKQGAPWGIRLPVGQDSFQSSLWMPWSAGAELSDGDEWTLDTPEMEQGLSYYQSFFADGIANPSADVSAGAVEAEFVAGTTPIVIDGPYLRGQLGLLGGEAFEAQYATAPLPTEESSVSLNGGSNLVVFDGSDNTESAWKLVDWLSQPEQQASFFSLAGDLPAVRAAWDAPAFAEDSTLDAFRTQLETAEAPPAVPTWAEVGAAGDQTVELLRRGTQTVQEALRELQAKADSIGMD